METTKAEEAVISSLPLTEDQRRMLGEMATMIGRSPYQIMGRVVQTAYDTLTDVGLLGKPRQETRPPLYDLNNCYAGWEGQLREPDRKQHQELPIGAEPPPPGPAPKAGNRSRPEELADEVLLALKNSGAGWDPNNDFRTHISKQAILGVLAKHVKRHGPKTFKLTQLDAQYIEDKKYEWRRTLAYVPSTRVEWFEPTPPEHRMYMDGCMMDIPIGTTKLHLSNKENLYVTESCEELESMMDAALREER